MHVAASSGESPVLLAPLSTLHSPKPLQGRASHSLPLGGSSPVSLFSMEHKRSNDMNMEDKNNIVAEIDQLSFELYMHLLSSTSMICDIKQSNQKIASTNKKLNTKLKELFSSQAKTCCLDVADNATVSNIRDLDTIRRHVFFSFGSVRLSSLVGNSRGVLRRLGDGLHGSVCG